MLNISIKIQACRKIIILIFLTLSFDYCSLAEGTKFREGSAIISLRTPFNSRTAKTATIMSRLKSSLIRFSEVERINDRYLFISLRRNRSRELFLNSRRNPCNSRRLRSLLSDINENNLIVCEPDYVETADLIPDDPFFIEGKLWNLVSSSNYGIDASNAWNISTGKSSVLIGIIDSGINRFHPDLQNNLWVNPGEIPADGIDNEGNGVIDDINGFNAILDSAAVDDDNGHGTHVAGIIGAAGNNSIGICGINWSIGLIATKFLDQNGSGLTSNAIKALNYLNNLKENGANLIAINNSWGSARWNPSLSLLQEIQRSRDLGILFIAAAGNNGRDNDNPLSPPQYPASYSVENIISVAASTESGELASFSNFGASSVDLAAPGSNILSTYVGETSPYTKLSGTSMAAPHVSAIAGLIASALPEADDSLIKQAIITSVTRVDSMHDKMLSPGILNAYNAIKTAEDLISASKITATPTSSPSATFTITATATTLSSPTATITPTPSVTVLPSASAVATPTTLPSANPTASDTPVSQLIPAVNIPTLSTPEATNTPFGDVFNSSASPLSLKFYGKMNSLPARAGKVIQFESSGPAEDTIIISIAFDRRIHCDANSKPLKHGIHKFKIPSLAAGFSKLSINARAIGRQSEATIRKKLTRIPGTRYHSNLKIKLLCRNLVKSLV